MPWKNPKDQRKWQRKRYNNRRLFLLKYKKESGGCYKCGFNKEPGILQFHHPNKSKKSFKICGSILANRSLGIIKAEIAKCDLLCPNCHAVIHYGERDWFQKIATKAL